MGPSVSPVRGGDPALSRQDLAHLTDESIEGFWEQVKDRSTEKDELGREPCWEWLGPEAAGRGLYSFKAEGGRVSIYAHHVSYFLRIGPILGGQSLFRLCIPGQDLRNFRSAAVCVNPVHWKLKGSPRSGREDHSHNGRRPSTYSAKDPFFTQGDLRSLRAAVERTARGRDVADAEDHLLTPAETFLIVLAEKILAALPEDVLGNYRITPPQDDDESTDTPTPVLTSTPAST